MMLLVEPAALLDIVPLCRGITSELGTDDCHETTIMNVAKGQNRERESERERDLVLVRRADLMTLVGKTHHFGSRTEPAE